VASPSPCGAIGALLSLLVPNIPPEVERVVETEWGGLEPDAESEPEPERA